MTWVHFTSDFNYRKPSFTIAYKAGMKLNVKADCADTAIAQGKAIKLRAPKRGEVTDSHGYESENSGSGSVDAQAQPDGTERE